MKKLILFSGLVLVGCVSAHRKTEVTHTHYVYSETGHVIAKDVWTDVHHGGGVGVFADPTVAGLTASETNQSALGGGSSFVVKKAGTTVSTNAINALSAALSAIAGEAISSAK